MKKFLLSLTLLGAVLLGNAQVILNELYTDPQKTNSEFIELFNTGLSSVNLDCYSIVVYYKSGSETGFYVMDLPAINLLGKEHFVAAAASSFTVQGSSSVPADFDWSSSSGLRKYVYNGTTYNEPIPLTNPQKNDVLNNFNDKDAKYAVFLFDGSTYVNGFLGGSGSSLPPLIIRQMPLLNVTTTNCSPFQIDWSKITRAEYTKEAIGGDNGYTRNGDGICGVWDKTSKGGDHTPGDPNPPKAVSSTSGGLSTNETILCGTKVSFKITATTDASAFPVTVTLYSDNNSDGILNSGDVPYVVAAPQTNPILVPSASNTIYTFDITAGQSVILVYQTALGCYYKVVALTNSTGSISTNEKNICGSRVDFTVNSSTGSATTFGFPLIARLYQDNGVVGTYEPGTDIAIGETREIISTSTTTPYSLPIPVLNKADNILIVYSSPVSCYTFAKTPVPTSGSYATSENMICNSEVAFTLTGATGDASTYSTFGSPVNIQIYYDINNSGSINTGDATQFTTAQPYAFGSSDRVLIAEANRGVKAFIVYSSASECFNKSVELVNVDQATIQTSTPIYTCGTTVKVAVTGATGSAAPYVLPIKVKLYYDMNSDGQLSEGELLDTETVSSYSTTELTLEVPADYKDAPVVISYETAVSCIRPTATPSEQGCTILPVTYASFTATRSSNSQVVLEWETAMEENNKGFHVQRNVNGEWKNIGFVFTQAANGNSTSKLKYSFKDANSSKGISQYRILQVDMDGKGRYSEVRSIRGEEMAARLTVFPNPSNTGSFSILFEEGSSVRDVMVSDVSGRAVKQYKGVSNSSLTIDNLGAGFYTVQVLNRTTGAIATEKVIIKKR